MYKALVSFSGKISMAAGEVREIADKDIADDLTKAGYIEEIPQKAKVPSKSKTGK